MANLGHGQIVSCHFAVSGPFSQLLYVEIDVAAVSGLHPGRRILLHLVGADVNRLYESPLESAGAAVTLESSLGLADACHMPTHRTIAGSARLLIVNAEIGVIG